ncbi:MAG: LytTR family DNA-binding domain-containing protein [Ferruginibacter sp.]
MSPNYQLLIHQTQAVLHTNNGVESLKDYVKVVTKTKNIITKQSIASLEEALLTAAFIHIHRSYIVAVNKIESYTSELIEITKQELPIGRMYRLQVTKVLNLD